MTLCPCGSTKDINVCCEPFINGSTLPATPEELMRSRYTAYSQARVEYIAKTMVSPAIDDFDLEDARKWASKVKWQGLTVFEASMQDNKGIVEFEAKYSQDQKLYLMHEVSQFRLEDGRWFYVDSLQPKETKQPKIGRNDACSCGSQKKYKKCCGLTTP